MTLKVVGAGFGRTGTASLKLALERLLGGQCYHMSEVFTQPEHMPLWIDAADGKPDWDAIFKGYVAACDFPVATFWRELAEYYSEAKIILTTRDAEKWQTSTQETILNPDFVGFYKQSPFAAFLDKTVNSVFDGRVHDRAHMIDVFRKHEAAVKAEIDPARLLVFDAKDGWTPLCAFLGAPVPAEPFPRVNSREETKTALTAMIAAMKDGAIDADALGAAKERLLKA